MKFSILTHAQWLLGQLPELVFSEDLWAYGVCELHRRTEESHESGAFLLGRRAGRTRSVFQFLFYDDVDPDCFRHGIVEFDGRRLGLVWQRCRVAGVSVVADVHVHPRGYGQSPSDKANPIMPNMGHVALILPNYASHVRIIGGVGVYEYRGNRTWKNYSRAGAKILRLQREPLQ